MTTTTDRADLLPVFWTAPSRNFPVLADEPDDGADDEGIDVFRSANRFCAEAGRGSNGNREACRKAGISEATFYNWRKKNAGLMHFEMNGCASSTIRTASWRN